MPEEHNRIATDHISEYLFAPTKNSKNNLISEKVHGHIFVTGNTIIDAINTYLVMSSRKSQLSIDTDNYILMTLHRAENVDQKKTLTSIISGILKTKQNIIFPVHPRTVKRLREFNLYEKLLKSKSVLLLDSVGYFEMLELMKKCSFIISDSGGIQEEATSPKLRKKVVILRKTTDRPEAVEEGFAELVGVSQNGIINAIKRNVKYSRVTSKKSPYGKGNASQTILKLINKHLYS
jgi:UDP-N-acetylglucosamine 2-epimerase (non-hydrolysing)